jgi:hypothetical protein
MKLMYSWPAKIHVCNSRFLNKSEPYYLWLLPSFCKKLVYHLSYALNHSGVKKFRYDNLLIFCIFETNSILCNVSNNNPSVVALVISSQYWQIIQLIWSSLEDKLQIYKLAVGSQWKEYLWFAVFVHSSAGTSITWKRNDDVNHWKWVCLMFFFHHLILLIELNHLLS